MQQGFHNLQQLHRAQLAAAATVDFLVTNRFGQLVRKLSLSVYDIPSDFATVQGVVLHNLVLYFIASSNCVFLTLAKRVMTF